MAHAIPKQATTNPLLSTGHCYMGVRLPSVQPSAESVCNPVMLPDSPRTTRLQNSLHPAVWLVTQSLLQLENLCAPSLCAWTIYMFLTENCQWRALLEMTDFLLQGRGELHNSPSLPAMWSRRYSGLHERICRRGPWHREQPLLTQQWS